MSAKVLTMVALSVCGTLAAAPVMAWDGQFRQEGK
jgi:hypothetical protein